jgi:hypothetical protein
VGTKKSGAEIFPRRFAFDESTPQNVTEFFLDSWGGVKCFSIRQLPGI